MLSAWIGSIELSMRGSSSRCCSDPSALEPSSCCAGEVLISGWRCAKAHGTGKNCSLQYMLWHWVLLSMSQRLKRGRESALSWQMSGVQRLCWPGFALGAVLADPGITAGRAAFAQCTAGQRAQQLEGKELGRFRDWGLWVFLRIYYFILFCWSQHPQ